MRSYVMRDGKRYRRESNILTVNLNNNLDTKLISENGNRVRIQFFTNASAGGTGLAIGLNTRVMLAENDGIVTIANTQIMMVFDIDLVGSIVTQEWHGWGTGAGQNIGMMETTEIEC